MQIIGLRHAAAPLSGACCSPCAAWSMSRQSVAGVGRHRPATASMVRRRVLPCMRCSSRMHWRRSAACLWCRTVADGVFATASSDATSDSVSAGLAVGVLRGLPLVSLRDTVTHGVPPIAATDAPRDSVRSILASEALHGLPWVSLQDTAVEDPLATASTGATPECVDPLGDGARRPFQGLPSLRPGDAVAAGASATASMDATSEGFGVVPQGISCGISGVDAALVQERRVGAWLRHSTPSWLRVVWEVLRDKCLHAADSDA